MTGGLREGSGAAWTFARGVESDCYSRDMVEMPKFLKVPFDENSLRPPAS